MKMKKKIVMLITLGLVLIVGCSACLAESQVPAEGWLRDSIDGAVWADDRASLEVIPEDDCYRVLIVWGSSAWETTEWTYTCEYDADKDRLIADHVICNNTVYDDNGGEDRTIVLDQDCETVIALNDEGKLVITNAADESLEGKAFERLPEVEGDV